jgi:hypothetical protein
MCVHLGYAIIFVKLESPSKPLKQPPRRVSLAFANEEKLVIEQMERQGIIRKSKSPWASPIVLVRKKNGKVRPCIDYRRLNSVTENDAFPLPRIHWKGEVELPHQRQHVQGK